MFNAKNLNGMQKNTNLLKPTINRLKHRKHSQISALVGFWSDKGLKKCNYDQLLIKVNDT